MRIQIEKEPEKCRVTLCEKMLIVMKEYEQSDISVREAVKKSLF